MTRTARASPIALVAAAAALVSLVLLASVPSHPRIWVVLSNAAHAPVFAVLSLLILHLVRTQAGLAFRPAAAWSLAAAIVLGIAIEVLQAFIGRDASLRDVWTDALGAACALGWVTAHEPTESRVERRTGWVIALVTACLAVAPVAEALAAYGLRTARMPTVARFSLPWDLYFVQLQSASARRVGLPIEWSRPGDPLSLEVRFGTGRWPGLSLWEPAPDWRGYRSLKIDLTNPGSRPLELVLRVHDALHDQRHEDRFNRPLTVGPGSRDVLTVPLADIADGPVGRRLDLGSVAGLILFASGDSASAGTEFLLTRIWLE